MPYFVRKVRNKPCYRVSKKLKKRVSKKNKKRVIFAKCTTQKNAIKQLRLLRALQYNKKFIPYSNSIRKTRKMRSK